MKTLIKADLHDLANFLMKADAYTKMGNTECLKQTIPLTINCFRNLRRHWQEITKNPEPLSIEQRLQSLSYNKDKLEEFYGLKIEVDSSKCPMDLYFISNPDTVQSISSNLIQNCAKAGATKLWIEYAATQNSLEVYYRDNGKGMTEDELSLIGFGYSCSGGGQGVDLIRRLIAEVGGEVTWRSIPNVGTEVKFRLKRYYPQEKIIKH